MDISSFNSKLIFKNDKGMGEYNMHISRDEKYIALAKEYNRDNSDIFLYDIKNNELKKVLYDVNDVNHNPTGFSLDSKSVYFLTDLNSEFNYLKKYNIESKQV